MSASDRAYLAAMSAAKMANGNHRTNFTPALNAVAAVGADVASDSAAALAAASQAAASLATALQITGGAQGVGTDPLDVPRNAELGSAAYVNWELLPVRVFALAVSAARILVGADGGRIVVCSGTFTVTLPGAADIGVGEGWAVWVKNSGAGTVTLAAAAGQTVDGAASVAIAAGVGRLVVRSTAAAYVTV